MPFEQSAHGGDDDSRQSAENLVVADDDRDPLSAGDAAVVQPDVGRVGDELDVGRRAERAGGDHHVASSVLFGPGGAGLHSRQEYVTTQDVVTCRDALTRLALDWC